MPITVRRETFGPLVSAAWLSDRTADSDLRVIDFRWYLDGRRGSDEYAKGHIPGAVFVDLESVTGAEGPGRHPLPSGPQFAAEMRKAGVSASTRVVAYDDVGGSVAARLWWMLRWFGHRSQAVLDGGIQAWPGALSRKKETVRPGNFRAKLPDRRRLATFRAAGNRRLIVLDARAGARYRGETEPIDPKAGHVPGARSATFTGNLAADGRFKSSAELHERFKSLGVSKGDEVIAYCGSGVNACHNLLALEVAGFRGSRLYEGSWSDWSRRDLPVATGNA
jgi:thiosulfate/3-mercaptopyruvate sulfurtransferase